MMNFTILADNILWTLVFLAGTAVLYYLLPLRVRWVVLPAASLLFYYLVDPDMVLLLLASSWWTWLCGERIGMSRDDRQRKLWLLASILPALGVLFVFKYFDFFSASAAALLQSAGLSCDLPLLKLAMPLGVSYYTFRIISYDADIYRGVREPSGFRNGYFDYLTYVLFFPQILAGPIVRSEDFMAQLHREERFDAPLFAEGLQRILLGLFKKLVIANRLSAYVDTIWASPSAYPGLAVWMAAVFYSFQLYCDFSGYSDIALGMGNLLGIRCPQNFDCPYFSRGIKEFWSRWHISLSSWLRDYVYIPLGGSWVPKLRHKLNLLVTFLVSGLWHGAGWNFIVWGGIHGVWNMLASKKEAAARPLRKLWQTLVTFAGVTLAWVFFRAESLGSALAFLRHGVMDFSLSYAGIQNSILPFTGDNTCAAHFLTVCFFLLLLFLYEYRRVYPGRGRRGGRNDARGADQHVGRGVSQGGAQKDVRGKSDSRSQDDARAADRAGEQKAAQSKEDRSGQDSARFSDESDARLSVPWIVILLLSVLFFGVFQSSGFLYANF